MAALLKPTYTKIDPKTGRRITKKSRKWYGQYVDADGITRRVPLCTDKAAAQAMIVQLEREAVRKRAGIVDASVDEAGRLLSEHLEDFRRSLAGENNTAKHVRQTCNRIAKILGGCGFVRLSDLSASRVVEWLAAQRKRGVMGIRTSNYYLTAIKSLCNWMISDKRMSQNPLAHLSALNAETDVRRVRRALPAAEFEKLLTETAGGKPFRRLTGQDRVVLYLTAVYTGLRESELASLITESFDLEAATPTVTVEAGYSKRRRRDTLPLHRRLVAVLRDWLPTRQPADRVWPGTWWRKGAEMIRRDMTAAGIPYRDGLGRVFDFHALRGQFITELGRQGVTLQEAQKLARHSDPRLTANFYTHLELDDLSRAVASLPEEGSDESDSTEQPARASHDSDRLALQLALNPVVSCPDVSSVVRSAVGIGHEMEADNSEKTLQKQGFDRDGHSVTSIVLAEKGAARIRTGDGGFAIRCLRPLGYGAGKSNRTDDANTGQGSLHSAQGVHSPLCNQSPFGAAGRLCNSEFRIRNSEDRPERSETHRGTDFDSHSFA